MTINSTRFQRAAWAAGILLATAWSLLPDHAMAQGEVADAVVEAPPPELPADTPAEPEEKKAEIAWTLSAGGSVNTGNTEAWTVSAGTDFKLVKNSHQLTIDSLFSYGRANPPDPAVPYDTNVKKFFFNSRYDYFLSEMDALWASAGERWDPLAGFNTQFLAQGGYLRAFVKKENHYFAGRIGYSYTYEKYATPPSAFVGTSNIHGLMAALDYDNKLNEHVQVLSTLLTVYNLNTIPVQNATAFQDIRIYYSLAFLANVSERLAFEVRFLLLYDRIPPTTKKTDTTTLFSLVYTLF